MATILRDFKFSRDYKSVHWGATLQYNALRAACAGLIFGILVGVNEGKWEALALIIGCPIIWMIFLPFGLLAAKLAEMGVPYIGLLTWPPALVIIPGDPLVWILSMFAPRLVAMEKPPFISLCLIGWVLKNEDSDEMVVNTREL